MIKLNCVLFGDDPENAFTIEIPQSENAYALKKLVKEETKYWLGPVDANRLKLFKVDLSEYRGLAFNDFKGKLLNAMPKASLHPMDKLYKLYPSGSPLDDENLHIVVLHPSDAPIASQPNEMNRPYAQDSASDFNDHLGVFGADDVQAILKEMNCEIDFILDAHPLVAAMSNVADGSDAGFLKFIRDGQREISILQHLSRIHSPQNHTIPDVRFWPVRGGQVISMPSGGNCLTDVRNDMQLRSMARQLFEAVDFMHQHGVAHLDLKPDNILIPPDGDRLSIIDFHASVRIRDVNTRICAVVGTPEYIPPEVAAGRDPFSAVRADLWSCGKILSELCDICWSESGDHDRLLRIASELMDEDPAKRPMVSEVQERMEL